MADMQQRFDHVYALMQDYQVTTLLPLQLNLHVSCTGPTETIQHLHCTTVQGARQ